MSFPSQSPPHTLPAEVPAVAPLRAPRRVRVDGKALVRGLERFHVRGVTYGPFASNRAGEQLPEPERVQEDFTLMRSAHVNSVRTYHIPPDWLLEAAEENALDVFIDVPWRKHLCFLESEQAQREAREAVSRAAKCGRHPSVLAYSIGNEIPPDVIRWHGRRRVERFLAELMDVAKQADPIGLVTYASYPPTEYLDLSFLDFVTFNVYLHDLETFRRYLFRLQNLVGDKPLLLGELGMDTLRHGEIAQAEFLAGHMREASLLGLAGAFIFSWTDDWHTGGHQIEDWAFGITRADRAPKASFHALREVFECSPAVLLSETPRVSVVVCSYNGGNTLEQCLRSLLALEYPDYEIILVDDGSTDQTRAIASRFPTVRCIHQPNYGLSKARNVGLRASMGAIVAYTDSDCFADPDWLTYLVYQLQRTGAAGVGGPNLTPNDGRQAACVAACPGQPTHVLVSDQVAEHIPGCNMAFRREALRAINGFDHLYRQAGDDVDLCWRLQQAGMWITFAPGAFVWHHRRQTPRAYLRQQAGYGKAEALLQLKHPDQFNHFGGSKWRGVLYGDSLRGLRLTRPLIYRGTFGTGLFQCLYQPGPAHWAMLPSTLEWHVLAGVLALATFVWAPAGFLALGLWIVSLAVAGLQAAQARLAPEHEGWRSRLLIAALSYAQPLVRSWRRYKTRLMAPGRKAASLTINGDHAPRFPLSGRYLEMYWTEQGCERAELLSLVIARLNELRCGKTIDSGWSEWDLQIYAHSWTTVLVSTTHENHGGNNRLIRVRYRLRLREHTKLLVMAGLLAATSAVALWAWLPAVAAGLGTLFLFGVWWRGTIVAGQAVAVVDRMAASLGLWRCDSEGKAERSTEKARTLNDVALPAILRAVRRGEVSVEEAALIAPIPGFVLSALGRQQG
jgi:GT2 family glycosyltransferase